METTPQQKAPYCAPEFKVLGSLHELTHLKPKVYSPTSDGFTFNGQLINS